MSTQVLCEETNGEAVITTGVGQHQMWAAQWYRYDRPRHWVSSGGLGSMGFGLPSALGAAAAFDGAHNCMAVTLASLFICL
jgi:acetolactate synthase I/II/III large subunit